MNKYRRRCEAKKFEEFNFHGHMWLIFFFLLLVSTTKPNSINQLSPYLIEQITFESLIPLFQPKSIEKELVTLCYYKIVTKNRHHMYVSKSKRFAVRNCFHQKLEDAIVNIITMHKLSSFISFQMHFSSAEFKEKLKNIVKTRYLSKVVEKKNLNDLIRRINAQSKSKILIFLRVFITLIYVIF